MSHSDQFWQVHIDSELIDEQDIKQDLQKYRANILELKQQLRDDAYVQLIAAEVYFCSSFINAGILIFRLRD